MLIVQLIQKLLNDIASYISGTFMRKIHAQNKSNKLLNNSMIKNVFAFTI